jgi:hypothetical protein
MRRITLIRPAARSGRSPAPSVGGKAPYEPPISNFHFELPGCNPSADPGVGVLQNAIKSSRWDRGRRVMPANFLPMVWPVRTGYWAQRLALRDATGAGHE